MVAGILGGAGVTCARTEAGGAETGGKLTSKTIHQWSGSCCCGRDKIRSKGRSATDRPLALGKYYVACMMCSSQSFRHRIAAIFII